jgi:hypothetical protein
MARCRRMDASFSVFGDHIAAHADGAGRGRGVTS